MGRNQWCREFTSTGARGAVERMIHGAFDEVFYFVASYIDLITEYERTAPMAMVHSRNIETMPDLMRNM